MFLTLLGDLIFRLLNSSGTPESHIDLTKTTTTEDISFTPSLRGQTVHLCLYVPGFQRQIFKYVKSLSERSKKMNEQKKNIGSVLDAESANNAQNAQFGLVNAIFFYFYENFL